MRNTDMLSERLGLIIDHGYALLTQQVAYGRLNIHNEASLQLHLASILKTLGDLYTFKPEEAFSIELEKTIIIESGTFSKSTTSKARIDIAVTFQDLKTGQHANGAIELKFFKKANFRESNNRYDVFRDLANLEQYDSFPVKYLIVGTDHAHYVTQEHYSAETGDFNCSNGSTYTAGTSLHYKTAQPYGPPIILAHSYNFQWHIMTSPFAFLKVLVPT